MEQNSASTDGNNVQSHVALHRNPNPIGEI